MYTPESLAAMSLALLSLFYKPRKVLSESKKPPGWLCSNGILISNYKLTAIFLIKLKERNIFTKINQFRSIQEFKPTVLELFGLDCIYL